MNLWHFLVKFTANLIINLALYLNPVKKEQNQFMNWLVKGCVISSENEVSTKTRDFLQVTYFLNLAEKIWHIWLNNSSKQTLLGWLLFFSADHTRCWKTLKFNSARNTHRKKTISLDCVCVCKRRGFLSSSKISISNTNLRRRSAASR